MEKEVLKIVNWIKTEVEKAGKRGCIIGISGGIDSAVTALLCKKAFPDTTYGILMPHISNIGASLLRSNTLCRENNITGYIQTITDESGFSNFRDEDTIRARGNFYARKRMTWLYFYAELFNSLVIGTDNKCENYIGYFTKYGDGGVDINPLGEYFKSEVYQLGKILGVPESIMEVKPSAELWDDQTDEDEIGCTYDELERAIELLESPTENLKELINSGIFIDSKLLDKVYKMHTSTNHKREIPRGYNRGT